MVDAIAAVPLYSRLVCAIDGKLKEESQAIIEIDDLKPILRLEWFFIRVLGLRGILVP